MQISIEISLYPLSENFISPIENFKAPTSEIPNLIELQYVFENFLEIFSV